MIEIDWIYQGGDVDNKPVGCAPSRLAELLKPNFHRGGITNIHAVNPCTDSLSISCHAGSPSLAVIQQHQSIMGR